MRSVPLIDDLDGAHAEPESQNNQNDDENRAAAEEKGERWGHGYAPWWLKLPLIVLRGLRECHVQTAKKRYNARAFTLEATNTENP